MDGGGMGALRGICCRTGRYVREFRVGGELQLKSGQESIQPECSPLLHQDFCFCYFCFRGCLCLKPTYAGSRNTGVSICVEWGRQLDGCLSTSPLWTLNILHTTNSGLPTLSRWFFVGLRSASLLGTVSGEVKSRECLPGFVYVSLYYCRWVLGFRELLRHHSGSGRVQSKMWQVEVGVL